MRKPPLTGADRAKYTPRRKSIVWSDPEENIRKKLRDAWAQAKQRCYNPKHPKFKNYGVRGIGMSNEWRFNFQKFYDDMRPTWAAGLTLDRIDPNGDYKVGNCRWTDQKVQQWNKTSNLWILCLDNQRRIQADAAYWAGISEAALEKRIKVGWPWERWFEAQHFDVGSYGRYGKRQLKRNFRPSKSLILSLPGGIIAWPKLTRGSLWFVGGSAIVEEPKKAEEKAPPVALPPDETLPSI